MDSWVLRDRLQSSMRNYDPGNIFIKSTEKLQLVAKITKVKNKNQQNDNSINQVKVTMSDPHKIVCVLLNRRRQFNLCNSASRKFDLFPSRMMPEGRKHHLDRKNKAKTWPLWSDLRYFIYEHVWMARSVFCLLGYFSSLLGGGGAFSRPQWAHFGLYVWAAEEKAAWCHGFAFISGLHSADTGVWISRWGPWTGADVGLASQIEQ